MTQVLSFLLSLILQYGYPTIALVIFLAELGIPLPVSSVLMAAGSFTVDGTLNMFFLIPLVAVTAIIGDSMGYWFGKTYGETVTKKYLRFIGLTEKRITIVQKFFKRWGFWCIFLSRFILTPFGIPVNLVAGISRYPFLRFLIIATIGEFMWATLYLYLGYIFGVNWVTFSSYSANTPWILVLLLIGITSLFIASRLRRKRS